MHKQILTVELTRGMIVSSGVIVAVNDWNKHMMQIVYCGWGYEGEVEKSTYFYLKAKDQAENVFLVGLKEKNHNKGHYYIESWSGEYLYIQPNITEWLLKNNYIKH